MSITAPLFLGPEFLSRARCRFELSVRVLIYDYSQFIDRPADVKPGPQGRRFGGGQCIDIGAASRNLLNRTVDPGGFSGVVERSNVRRAAANTSAREQQSAPRVGRRERNKQEKRARIVSAARKLFRERGFAETTTQQIAEKADIGTGTLFLYAKSKEDILVMVFKDEMIETARLAFASMPAKGSLVDRLMHVFGLMIRYHERDIDLSRILLKEIMFQTAPERREDISELMEVIYAGIADLLKDVPKAGRARTETDALLAAEVLFAVYYMGLLVWLGQETSKKQFTDKLRLKLEVAINGFV
ncbi:MAG: TetR/AcrR family transcriptional regulator [Rhizomicrobium sp.]